MDLNRNVPLGTLLILMLMFVLIFSTISPVVVRASPRTPRTRLYLEDDVTKSPMSTASPGETFNISLRLENVLGLYGYGAKIRWNGTVLNATHIYEGDFLKLGGSTFPTFKIFNEPDPGGYSDYLIIMNTLLAAIKGVGGRGVLATITFLVETEGETLIDLFYTDLPDDQAGLIEHSAEDAYFSVTPPTLSVDPALFEDATKVPGEYFTINVTISDVTDLYEFEFKLSYEKSLLNATELTIVPFLNEPTQVLNQTIDRKKCVVIVRVNSTAATPVSGNGTLASITFQVLSVLDEAEEGVLDLYDTRIRDKLSKSVNTYEPERWGDDHNPPAVDGYFDNEPVGHDIAVTKIVVYPREVTVGESVSINVTVTNAGGFNETFDVSIRYDGNDIDTQTNINLTRATKTKIEFTWVTSNVAPGEYSITAYASEVPDEANTDNNQLAYKGKVTVESGAGSDITLYAVAVAAVFVVAAVLVYFVKVRKPKGT